MGERSTAGGQEARKKPPREKVTVAEVRGQVGSDAETVYFTMGRADRQYAFMVRLEHEALGIAIIAAVVCLLAIYI